VDSDYVGDLDKCQSTTGYMFTLYSVISTDELALYFTAYCYIVDDRSNIYDNDRAYEEDNLVSRVDG